MKRAFRQQKIFILAALAVFLVADLAMAAYSLVMANSKLSPQQELAEQTAQLKLLKADVDRAQAIQRDMPKTKGDCDRFEDSLPSGSSGYSAISGEIAELGHKAGLQIASLGFHPKELPGKGMTEVALEVSVAGDYQGVVRFMNGMQRSKNHYVVESLTLATDSVVGQATHGAVKVNFHLTSYFRGAA
jgi:type IV pilus assembly protein PilO